MASFSSDDNSFSTTPTDKELLALFGLKRNRLNDQGRKSLLEVWSVLGGRVKVIEVGSTFLLNKEEVYAVFTGTSPKGWSAYFDLKKATDDTKIGDGYLGLFDIWSGPARIHRVEPCGISPFISYEILEVLPPLEEREEEEEEGEEEEEEEEKEEMALALLGKCLEAGTYPSKITIEDGVVSIDF